MSEEEIQQLLEKYAANKCTEAEIAQLEHWYIHLDNEVDVPAERIGQLKAELRSMLPANNSKRKIRLWAVAASTVAAALVISIMVIAHWKLEENLQLIAQVKHIEDIAPGGNRATLTLSNGQTIQLNENKKAIITPTSLAYDDGSKIAQQDLTGIQTITTPKGGQYQVVLPDGTKVWLNAASTLEFPAAFRLVNRTVGLSGEAYFEVAKDKAHPFIVKINSPFDRAKSIEIKVLGTHFNINSYHLEIKTTLIEGAVKVSADKNLRPVLLSPGEQATYNGKSLFTAKADIDLEMAWKNGKIEFMDADITSIMQMLERWYDIEAVYIGIPTKTPFTGSISRNKNISEILRLLETTGDVHFKIEGRRIKVLSN